MELPVIESHLIGSTGLYGASIGAPGLPLPMGIQISEQNGVNLNPSLGSYFEKTTDSSNSCCQGLC